MLVCAAHPLCTSSSSIAKAEIFCRTLNQTGLAAEQEMLDEANVRTNLAADMLLLVLHMLARRRVGRNPPGKPDARMPSVGSRVLLEPAEYSFAGAAKMG